MRRNRPVGKTLLRRVFVGLLAVTALLGATRGTQDAVANGDTRTLEIIQMHTRERVSVTFRRNGRYDERALEQLNWIMRDWRRNEATKMNPRLYDLLWEVHRSAGSRQPVRVVSAYRAPETNAMLRRRSSNVAQTSQHMTGNAVDFYLSDVPAERLRTIGMRMQRGGVGYYPRANTPFIHLDVGSVRHWPRMSRQQLVGLFPDQRTVHVPADGRPLAGFEQARREVLAAGGMVAGERGSGSPATPQRRSLWAALFGGVGEESDEDMAEAQSLASSDWIDPASMQRMAQAHREASGAASPARAPAAIAPAPAPAPVVAARAPAPAPVAPALVAAAPTPPPAPVAPAPASPAPLPPAPVMSNVAPLQITSAPLPPTPPAPVQSAAPAPAPAAVAQAPSEPVPLPVARPGELGGRAVAAASPQNPAQSRPGEPQLVWNQGPSGIPGGEGREIEAPLDLAALPLPPPRPSSAEVLGTIVTAFAGTPRREERDALAQLGIEPPALRGAQNESYASIPTILPPRRDAAALAALVSVPQAAAPSATASVAATSTREANAIAVARDARSALRSLFVARSAVATPAPAATRIAVAKARPQASAPTGFVAAQGSGIAQGFSKQPTNGPSIGSFAGPAVAPLQLTR